MWLKLSKFPPLQDLIASDKALAAAIAPLERWQRVKRDVTRNLQTKSKSVSQDIIKIGDFFPCYNFMFYAQEKIF